MVGAATLSPEFKMTRASRLARRVITDFQMIRGFPDIAPRSSEKQDHLNVKPFIGTRWGNQSCPAELGQQSETSLTCGEATLTWALTGIRP